MAMDMKDCTCSCDCCGSEKEVANTASREVLLAELKSLLNDSSANGRADRQTRIDELIAGLDDLAEAD